MSERSAHSVCRKDDDVGYENVSKQMSGRSAHSESRKHDEVEYVKSSKQMSEHSQSKKDDEVQYEKRSKRKHDESAAESEAESEHVSNTVDRQGGTKEQKSYKSSTLKEKADDEVRQDGPKDQESFKSPQNEKQKEADVHEVSQTSKVQHDAGDVSGSKLTKRTQFMRIFTYEDHKIILKALYETGYTTGSKPFWDRIGHTLQLSIPADQKQVYSKVRRLRDDYLKGYKENFSKRERRIYNLSDQIWNKVAKAKAKAKAKAAVQLPRKKAKHKQEVVAVDEEEDNYDMKLEKFVRGLHNDVKFPVVESLEVVDASKRSRLQKKWNDLNGYMFKLYMTKIDLIRETMEAVVSSPPFPSADD